MCTWLPNSPIIGHPGGGITFCWLNRKHQLTMAYLTNVFVAAADQYRRSQEMGRAIVGDKKALEAGRRQRPTRLPAIDVNYAAA